jgi:alpha-1,3-rhamnosyl/mannosyltransferase
VVIHDLSFIDIPADLPTAMVLRMRTLVGLTVRRAAIVMAVSEFTRGRVIDHYGLSPERVVVTPNGVAPQWRRLVPEERCARLAGGGLTGLPERFVLAIGTRHTRKNLDRLVRAVAAVRASGDPEVGLVLAGPSGTGAAAIRSEVARLHADDWVRSVGYVPDDVLVALVGAASAVAYPSRYEGFGLPVLEAMACGAIVVASNLPSIAEVAGDAAILVDPDSDDGLAAGLSAALTDDDLRDRLALVGPSLAATFDWDRCAAATVDAYRRALAS